jgi:hypothetical protein
MEVDVVPVGDAGVEGAARVETIAVHTSFVPAIEHGFEDLADVFLALDVRRAKPSQVSYVVVRDSKGSYHLPGECLSEGEALLRQRLNGQFDATIEAVIGLTERRQILELPQPPTYATGLSS